jgi:hypothetical protein
MKIAIKKIIKLSIVAFFIVVMLFVIPFKVIYDEIQKRIRKKK